MGIFKITFGGGGTMNANASLTLEEAIEIIENYGSILESKHSYGCVADVNKLPYPKDQIKEALVIALNATTDSDMKEYLKIGYITLADWQDGVGDRIVGINPSDIDFDAARQELVKKIGELGDEWQEWQEKWFPIWKAEGEALKQELVILGLWESIIIQSTLIDDARRWRDRK